MNGLKFIYLLIIVPISIASCKRSKNSYAIRDFKKSIQPHLTKMASRGIVYYYDSSLRYMANDNDLVQLTKAENPILRASAFTEILNRESFDHFNILMNNLVDTATVPFDAGEWGTQFSFVSDYLIEHSTWKDTSQKALTIEVVIKKHNYLVSAYTILDNITPQEKYYSEIKNMTQRERPFWQIELALTGLAKFKKAGDYEIIKNFLLKNIYRLSYRSFELMKDYPSDLYFEVLKTYSEKTLFRNSCIDRDITNALKCIETVAAYKQKLSADILKDILNKTNSISCVGTDNLKAIRNRVFASAWANKCEAYTDLLKPIAQQMLKQEKDTINLPTLKVEAYVPGERIIRWHN